MSRFHKIRKFFTLADLGETDEFTTEIRRALGGLQEKTREFTTGVADYAMEKEMTELRERITKLEAIILPMRNGSPTRQH